MNIGGRFVRRMAVAVMAPACLFIACGPYCIRITDKGAGAYIADRNDDDISMTSVQPGKYLITFPKGASNLRCSTSVPNTIGFITASDSLRPHQILVLTYGLIGPSNMHDFMIFADR